MIDNYQKKKLSIVIPTYNGEEFLADTLSSIVAQHMSGHVEVVVCDDCSSDKTCDIAQTFIDKYQNIKLFKNAENLGMDGNFEKAASHATGEYIWFCGQDDVIGQGAVRKVLEVLLENSNIDFIFVNYSQNNHDMSKVVTDKMLQTDHDTLCKDPQLFFSITGIIFPTFLPAYVLRKTLWDTVDKRPFYQTHYIQIGVFSRFIAEFNSLYYRRPHR